MKGGGSAGEGAGGLEFLLWRCIVRWLWGRRGILTITACAFVATAALATSVTWSSPTGLGGEGGSPAAFTPGSGVDDEELQDAIGARKGLPCDRFSRQTSAQLGSLNHAVQELLQNQKATQDQLLEVTKQLRLAGSSSLGPRLQSPAPSASLADGALAAAAIASSSVDRPATEEESQLLSDATSVVGVASPPLRGGDEKEEPTEKVQDAAVPAAMTVHVVYSTNTVGFYGLLNSMVSVSLSVRTPSTVEIHLLVGKESSGKLRDLLECFEREASRAGAQSAKVVTHVLAAGPSSAKLEASASKGPADRAEGGGKRRRTDLLVKEAYAGFYLDSHLANVSRVIWLDTDTIVTGELELLYRQPMRTAVAAVPLNRSKLPGTAYHYLLKALQQKEDWGSALSELRVSRHSLGGPIFNAGVFMVDLVRWRAEGLAAKCETWLNKLSGIDTDTIQLPMNLVLHGNFDWMDWRWNVDLTQQSFGTKLREARILHWVGRSKPWHDRQYSDHLYEAWDVSRRCPAVHPGKPPAAQ